MDDIRIPKRIIDGDLAGWLRDAMNARHMSPRMVGMRTGLNPKAIAGLLYGGREPSLMTLMALLDLFPEGSGNEPLVNQQEGQTSPPGPSPH